MYLFSKKGYAFMLRDLVLENRSYRSFDESDPVTREMLLEWVDNARLTPSAVNAQPLKYRLVDTKEGVEKVLPHTAWAGALKDITLPPEGKHPTAFVVICHDTTVRENPGSSATDVGIAAMTLLLSATEAGYGGCMIGAFNRDRVGEVLRIPEKYVPVLLVALGRPAEMVFLAEPKDKDNVIYYRDDHNLHFVPKRKLEDILID